MGSPAKFVVIVVASGMLPTLQVACSSMHALLFSRFRVVCTAPGINGGTEGLSSSLTSDPELRKHLNGALLPLPVEVWNSTGDPRAAHQRLLEQVTERQNKLETVEMKKYSGLSQLKE